MSARIESDGAVVQLDGRTEPDEVVTPEDAADTSKLARLLARVLKDIATLKRRWAPQFIDFEDVVVSTAGASVTLAHGFGGRVRWHLVGWQSSGTSAPVLKEDTTNTTATTLVLLSYVAGTATVRVEEA